MTDPVESVGWSFVFGVVKPVSVGRNAESSPGPWVRELAWGEAGRDGPDVSRGEFCY